MSLTPFSSAGEKWKANTIRMKGKQSMSATKFTQNIRRRHTAHRTMKTKRRTVISGKPKPRKESGHATEGLT